MHREPRWYALKVRHQHERRASDVLERKGIETLLPMYRARRRWSDRVKSLDLPVFSGYLFCRVGLDRRSAALQTPGVSGLVSFGHEPAPIDDREIGAIQRVIASGSRFQPWPKLEAGDIVRVERGPLAGVEGPLLRTPEGARIVLGIEILRRSVAVEVDPEDIFLVRRKAAAQK